MSKGNGINARQIKLERLVEQREASMKACAEKVVEDALRERDRARRRAESEVTRKRIEDAMLQRKIDKAAADAVAQAAAHQPGLIKVPAQEVFDPSQGVLDCAEVKINRELGVFVVVHQLSGVDSVDVVSDFFKRVSDFTHCSSPFGCGCGAGTPSGPVSNVAEDGGVQAADGAGAASPATAQLPRFVAVGEYVYDRVLNLVSGFWPGRVAAAYAGDLNSDALVVSYLNWEDAK